MRTTNNKTRTPPWQKGCIWNFSYKLLQVWVGAQSTRKTKWSSLLYILLRPPNFYTYRTFTITHQNDYISVIILNFNLVLFCKEWLWSKPSLICLSRRPTISVPISAIGNLHTDICFLSILNQWQKSALQNPKTVKMHLKISCQSRRRGLLGHTMHYLFFFPSRYNPARAHRSL